MPIAGVLGASQHFRWRYLNHALRNVDHAPALTPPTFRVVTSGAQAMVPPRSAVVKGPIPSRRASFSRSSVLRATSELREARWCDG
jgi:hypothetical protein